MRRGRCAARRRRVDLGVRARAHGDLAFAHGAAVHDEPGDRRLHVGDVDDVPVAADPAGVGLLAAALGVERGAVEDHLDGRARARRGHPDAVDDEPDDLRLGHQVGVAEERGAARGVEHGAVGRAVGVAVLVRGGVGLGPAALLGHQRAEALLVDGQPGLGGHLQREVDREAVGVVQLERLVAGQLGGARLPGRGGRAFEDLRAGGERLEEGLLLDPHDGGDALEVGGELRVGRGHGVAHDLGERGQHRLVDAEQPGRAHDPAQQAAQHVAAALVGRGHAVADDHDAGPGVVGDHPEADVVDLVVAVAAAGELLGAGDHRAHEVGVVDVRPRPAAGSRRARSPCRCRCSSCGSVPIGGKSSLGERSPRTSCMKTRFQISR